MRVLAAVDASAGDAVRAALIGAGAFGRALIHQAQRVPGLTLSVVCDVDPAAAHASCLRAGVPEARLTRCADRSALLRALESDRLAVVGDSALVMDLPVDVVVEATGDPEAGAANALAAIAHGKHVAMVTKEADSVVGPALHRRAAAAGRVYMPVDGDQPGLLMGLVAWARALGFEIVCAGKSSEYDFVFDADAERVRWRDREVHAPGFRSLWRIAQGSVEQTVARRAAALHALPQRTVPDLCEMGIVANATGLGPDVPAFHLPLLRTVEVPDVLCPAADGGLLTDTGVVDVFNAIRRPDEVSFAGGVFVIVACSDRDTWAMLAEKGMPVSANGRYAMLYNPQHLLGLEAPLSILGACRTAPAALAPRQRYDLVARARRTLRAGERLTVTDAHHHEVADLEPLLLDAAPARGANPVPYYLGVGHRLLTDVPAGALVPCQALSLPDDSVLRRLRSEQDRALA